VWTSGNRGGGLTFNLPLFWGMVVTGIVAYATLLFEKQGFRPIELIIGSLVGVIGLCDLLEMFIAPIDWGSAAVHSVLPQLDDAQALTISVGIIGATACPTPCIYTPA
jgi:manganese transport protein